MGEMKTPEQVDEIMAAIPEKWRVRWCGGENGPCACMGCVYTGSKQVAAEKALGRPYMTDPEMIQEALLIRNYPEAHQRYMLTRDEWQAWAERQKKA